jgi:hypothetical protein
MTGFDDDVRAALRDRAADLLTDNPTRAGQVHTRIRHTRRRWAATAAAALAVLAGTAALVTGPARTRVLPAAPIGVFNYGGTTASVPGFGTLVLTIFPGNDAGPAGIDMTAAPDDRPYLLAVRCPRPGRLDVVGTWLGIPENAPPAQGRQYRIECDRRVDGGYEGVLRLTGAQGRALFRGPLGQVELRASGRGSWTFAVLAGTWPDWLPTETEYEAALLDGRAHPAGGRFSFVTTAGGTLPLQIECVPGVVLDLRVGGRPYGGTVRCTSDQPRIVISGPTGAGPGASVGVDVVRTGRDTGQWRIGLP